MGIWTNRSFWGMVRSQAGSYIRSPTPGTWKAALVSFESECKPLGNRWLFSIWIFGNWGGRSSNHSSDGIRFVWRSSLSLWHRKCLTQHTHVFPGISSFTLKHVSKTSFVPHSKKGFTCLLSCHDALGGMSSPPPFTLLCQGPGKQPDQVALISCQS